MSWSTLPLFGTDDGWPYPDLHSPLDAAADTDVDLDALDLRADPHAFDTLTAREREAMFMHFGFDRNEPMPMKELCRALGCSHREARDLVGAAVDKMRRHLTDTGL